MFNIEEGTNEHREEVFQRRIKMLQQAYRDGFFNETGITPMPEITSDGIPQRQEDELELALAIREAAARQKARNKAHLHRDRPTSGYEPPTATEDPIGSRDEQAFYDDHADDDPKAGCGNCSRCSSEKYCKTCCLWFMVAEIEVNCPRCQEPLWEPQT